MNRAHHYTVIMGMGKTGLACARFLAKQAIPLFLMDNRPHPPGLADLSTLSPTPPYLVGRFDAERLAQAQAIIISPGLSLSEPALVQAQARHVPIISEIELFARHVNAPVVAITGSNGKSTVTTLLGEMAQQAGWSVKVGGNLGTPAVDLLTTPAPDLYILELSSFQLETTYSLTPKAATVLNISEDHMDRYATLADYIAAKKRIFQGKGTWVINADDPHVLALLPPQHKHLSFSLRDDQGHFRVGYHQGEGYLLQQQGTVLKPLLPISAIPLKGAMMRANLLAALALGAAINLPLPAMLETIGKFRGLPHRCVWVATVQGIDWFNDSKGTNVGATIAAIQGLERPKRIMLIAGGEGKGADFSPLAAVAEAHLKACLLIGRDAALLAKILENRVPLHYADSLEQAVEQAANLAQAGDAVLLSPACASFDMFNNYIHRGEVFEAAVYRLSKA